jgi:hypothetical protein
VLEKCSGQEVEGTCFIVKVELNRPCTESLMKAVIISGLYKRFGIFEKLSDC